MGQPWPATPLQPFANARLMLAENAIPGDTTSAVVAAHVLECCLSRGNTVVAPCEGLIWLGNLSLLIPSGAADVDPYAQHTQFTVLEFGASHGSGGIGALVQPLIGERIFGTLKPNKLG